jgi:hypothetical protein
VKRLTIGQRSRRGKALERLVGEENCKHERALRWKRYAASVLKERSCCQ